MLAHTNASVNLVSVFFSIPRAFAFFYLLLDPRVVDLDAVLFQVVTSYSGFSFGS